ncbi:MAG TPA: hypothetical protein PLG50_02250 [bacterium]|nr:hypothetical protein [bacterium]HQG44465.1 hypothetical protein [bacterium]HQI49115.1 hypothetical protein [bacterium]HQJ63763.1 hypothetical protein [bacterium]
MKSTKLIGCGTLILVAALVVFFWWRYLFVFGEGVKAGDLNYIVKKGYLFKTWEGRLIQTGFRTPVPGGMQSNEFEFSVVSDSLAKRLEGSSGKFVELRYKEYLHPLPWRGMSRYVVIGIIRIEAKTGGDALPF